MKKKTVWMFLSLTITIGLLLATGSSAYAAPPVITPEWDAFVIREANDGTSGPPLIVDNDVYETNAVEFVVFAGGQKAALGTDAISGKRVSQIDTLHIDRLDDVANSGSLYGPYFNVWITDGCGHYAVIANEPSDGEWALDRWDVPNWDFLKTKRCKVYEITGSGGGQPGTSWVAVYTGKSTNLVFEDIADLTIEAPPASYISAGNGVGSGAPDELGTNAAYGFNWVFGDTLSNYVSGDEGFVVNNYSATISTASTITVSSGDNIQTAIDNASPGDTINVSAGIYSENITINKPLEINGACEAIIDGTTLGGTGVKITSGNVTFNNFEVRNFDNGIVAGNIDTGLHNVHITNNYVHDIMPTEESNAWEDRFQLTDTPDTYPGFGIYAGYKSGALNEDFSHLDYYGLEISGNELTNTRTAALALQSVTSSVCPLKITCNRLHDVGDSTGNYNYSVISAIWLDSARNVLIEKNNLYGYKNGIYMLSLADGDYAYVLDGDYGSKNIEITENNIYNNGPDSFGYAAIGIVVLDGWPSTFTIDNNNIYNNATAGVKNFLTETVTAENNWWGSAPPASNAGDGLVDINPWLSSESTDAGYNESDCGRHCKPTIITLSAFEALPGNKSVALVWETSSETDNAGFNIYRSENGGGYKKINADLIPAVGSPAEGALYEFIDQDVKNRRTYAYKLEDIDFDGLATMHDAVSAMPRLIYDIGR